VFIQTNLSLQISEIEKELKVIDELSRISQIKSISNEIKQANRKSHSCQSQNATKPVGKSMKINNNLVIKGNITSGNILAEEISISDNVNIAKALSSNQIITGKVFSQTTILNEIRSPTVNIDLIIGSYHN
jgi:flagellar hook assembly protein FlgD